MKILISVVWLIAAMYLGAVGWNAAAVYQASTSEDGRSYDYLYKPANGDPVPLNFATKGEVLEFKRSQQWEEGDWSGLLFSWMPRNYAPFLVPMIFGLLGGALGSLVILWRNDATSIERILLQPLVGLAIGAIFYAMSMIIPKLLTAQETAPSWFALIWLSLVGGFFSEHAIGFAKRLAEKIFGKAPTTKKAATPAH
jgi:hypothetical protein